MVDMVMGLPEGTKLMLLAPVVQSRKGEHGKLMAQLLAQGFVRARIDGEVYELDDPPKLDLRRKHTIEAVVDRFKVREDLALRLAESFETALALADGVAHVTHMDEPERAPLIFSDRFSCSRCGYAIAELEPRLFLFQQPGRCVPGVRRLRRQTILRSPSSGSPPSFVSGRRRHPRVGPSKRLLFPDDSMPGGLLPFRYRATLRGAFRKSPKGHLVR